MGAGTSNGMRGGEEIGYSGGGILSGGDNGTNEKVAARVRSVMKKIILG